MKKILSCLCMVAVVMSCLLCLTACNDGTSEAKVMNVSLNPEVEFVLSKDDKVVSVNALNDEGNLVINAQSFVGKTEEEAIKLYIDVCKETGFLVSGSLVNNTDNQITISFSGDNANKSFDKIKDDIEKYFTDLGITATLKKGADLTSEYLNKLVEECFTYLDKAQVSAMSYKEKLDAIVESRKETCQMYSQELKELYYQVKADAINEVRIEDAKNQISGALATIRKAALDLLNTTYTGACTLLTTTYNNVFVKDTSIYQVALKTFTEKKADFLKYKNQLADAIKENNTAQIQVLTGLMQGAEGLLTTAQTNLETAKTNAKNDLTTLRTSLDNAYKAIINQLEEWSIQISNDAQSMQTELTTIVTNCKTTFETTYASALTAASKLWEDMKKDLTGKDE